MFCIFSPHPHKLCGLTKVGLSTRNSISPPSHACQPDYFGRSRNSRSLPLAATFLASARSHLPGWLPFGWLLGVLHACLQGVHQVDDSRLFLDRLGHDLFARDFGFDQLRDLLRVLVLVSRECSLVTAPCPSGPRSFVLLTKVF